MKSYRIITLLIIFMLLFSLNIDVSSGAIAPHLDQAGNGDVPYRIAAPDSWWIDVIDETAANIGEYPSLAIDQKDYPHIAYTDASNSRLVYYYQDQFGDHFERFSASQGTGNFPSLKLDEYGRAHIGYLDTTYDHLYYTYQDGSGNFTPGEDVAGDVGFSFLNLGFDEDDDPIFSYYEKSNQNLRFAYRGPHYPPWYTLKLAHYSQNLDVGKWASMAVDKNGFPHLSYSNETQGNLMYVYKDFGGWRQPITIDSPGNVGMHTSLALDQYGNPHISYLEWEYLGLSGYYYYLKYAYRDLFGQWHIEMVDDEGTAGEYSSIAIDNAGRPHISYYDHYGGDLLYATRDSNGTWYRYYVDDIGDVGIDSDIALDSNGNPRIAYYEAFSGSSGRLKYAAFTPPVSPFSANTGCAWGSHDCNPCVRNVVSA